jgi:hypothetical protein
VRRTLALAVLALVIGAAIQPAFAAAKTFTGAVDSNWNTAGNWNPSGVPTSTDDVVINSGTVHLTGADGDARSISINTGAPNTGGLAIDDHKLTVSTSGTSTINGFLGVTGTLVLGDATTFGGSSDSGGINVSGTLEIGSTFTITGSDTPNNANINDTSGTSVIDVLGTGSLVRSTSTGLITIGPKVDNDGSVSVQTGTLSLAGGDAGSTTGSYAVSAGATLRTGNSFESPSITGAGTLDVAGGTTTVASTDTFTPAELQIDNNATITLNKNVSISSVVAHAGHRNGTGSLTVTDSADFSGLALDTGTTTVAATVPSFTIADFLSVGSTGVGTNATLNLNAPTTYDGSCCSNGINLGGGILNIASSFEIGGTGIAAAINDTGGMPVINILSGGSFTRATSSAGVVVEPPIDNAGTFAVDTGTLDALGGLAQESGGSTTIAQGAELDGGVTLNGGTLKGGGTLGGPVENVGGAVAPGASPGTLTITGDYTQDPGGTLQVDVDGPIPGTQFDVLAVGGVATLAGTLEVVQGGGFTPTDGSTFTFLTYGSRSGQFGTLTGAAIAGGGVYTVDYPAGSARLVVGIPLPGDNTKPAISGNPSVGQMLSCDPGSWSGSPTFTFQWLRDGSPVAGATGQQYTVTSDDQGHSLACLVTATNNKGAAQATSDPVAVPAPSTPAGVTKPASSGAPSIPPTGKAGATVTCNPGTWSGSPNFAFAWLRNGTAIAGATAQAYTLQAADAGKAIVCRVTATNSGGSAQADSNQLVVELEQPPAAPPSTCGSGSVGGEAVCVTGDSDLQRFGCVRIGNFVHRFPVALKKKVKGLPVNRRSRVTLVIFTLDGRPDGTDRKRPFVATVLGTKLTPGKHTLTSDVRLQVPKTKKKFRKKFSFTFSTCG